MARKVKDCRRRAGKRASILILTVWTLFFLAALAVAVGSYVSGGLMLARKAAADGYGRAAMMAGVEHACAVLGSDTNDWDGPGEDWGGGGSIDWSGQRLGDAAYGIYHTDSMGVTNAGMIDEESRININKATKEQLEAAFRIIGQADAIAAASLAAAAVDWRDEDDEITEGGVESGYYSGLQPGYRCANKEFSNVYELLLLRGMTDDIFERIYGSVTVYGAGKINLNTADSAVLQVLAEASGADEDVARAIADRIVGFRQSGGSFSEASAMGIAAAVRGSGMLGIEEETVLMRMMIYFTLKGTCFRGSAEGWRPGFPGSAAAEFVYSRDKGQILFWKEL